MNVLKRLSGLVFSLGFVSCSILYKPVKVTDNPVTGEVEVYHFIIDRQKRKNVDTFTYNTFVKESKQAYTWLSKEAEKNGKKLSFREYWPVNKDSTVKDVFVYKLPTNNLSRLIGVRRIKKSVFNKNAKPKRKVVELDLYKDLIDSILVHMNDSLLAEKLREAHLYENRVRNKLLVIHVLKAQKSKILGFCHNKQVVVLGVSSSITVAHESVHYLGAPDLYIHRYWLGKRRRIVKKKMWSEIMDQGIPNAKTPYLYYISNYTAHTIGWTQELQKQYKPLMRQNRLAAIMFKLWLKI